MTKSPGTTTSILGAGASASFADGAAQIDTRYSFTAQFLHGAALMARRADVVDVRESVSEEERAEHRAQVVAAIMQACAALETDVSEVCLHGPGHHLGSNREDAAARDFLTPLAELIDGRPTLERYETVLHLLRRPSFDRGSHPFQPVSILVRLRNELVHYKSKWGAEMEQGKLFRCLEALRFLPPAFMSEHTNYFPHRCLSSSLASWAVTSAAGFIDAFYSRLEVPSPLAPYAARLVVPGTRLKK